MVSTDGPASRLGKVIVVDIMLEGSCGDHAHELGEESTEM